MKYLYPILAFLISFPALEAQTIRGDHLLDQSIQYHDPNGLWATFKSSFTLYAERPDRETKVTKLNFDRTQAYFELSEYAESNYWTASFAQDQCRIRFNGSEDFSSEIKQTYGLNCERMKRYRDYYTYLMGLPMKLKDPGTLIAPQGILIERQGTSYWMLKVTYEPEVGSDTWYFYFDTETFALKQYQFFHNEAKNDGEYIILEEEIEIGGIRMPKKRSWYYNSDQTYLGTDHLAKQNMDL